jgi:alpha-glucosidase
MKKRTLFIVLVPVIVICLLIAVFMRFRDASAPVSNVDYFATDDVFHDQGWIYMEPLEPRIDEEVVVRLRARTKNLDLAQIKYTIDDGKTWHTIDMTVEKKDETGFYEFWKGKIPGQSSPVRYRFVSYKSGEQAFTNILGSFEKEPNNTMHDFWIKPGFTTPEWSKGALWYSIMPDAFYNGDVRNDYRTGMRVKESPWGNSRLGNNDWYSGDLKGITYKAETYLKKRLGITALFINPIWTSTHNAGYGSFDLNTVNPVLGTEQDLINMTEKLHSNNIKLMLDGVFKYHHSYGIWFNDEGHYPLKGAFQSKESPYYDLFKFHTWPGNTERDWGMPVLDFSNELTRKFVYAADDSIMQRYLKAPYNVDGWRLDVGETLWGHDVIAQSPRNIMKDMRQYVKKAKPDSMLLSEHAPYDIMVDDVLDSKWNYDFGLRIRDWATGERSQSILDTHLSDGVRRLPRPIALASYNFLTTHDESRIMRQINHDDRLMNAAQILQMTYLGAPCIYYGDEIGLRGDNTPGVGDKAPTGFGSFDWNKENWNYKILNAYSTLSDLRKEYTALRTGVYKTLLADNRNKIYSFGRWDGEGKIISIVSQNTKTVNVKLEARQLSLKDGAAMVDWMTGREYVVKDGYIELPVLPNGGTVLVYGGEKSGKFRGEYEIAEIGSKASGKIIASEEVSSFTFDSSGKLGGASDKVQYVFTPAFNNFEYVTKVEYVKGGSSNKAGIMLRSDSEPDSKYYGIFLDGKGNLSISYREKAGNKAVVPYTGKAKDQPWIKVERKNNVLTAYTAIDNEGVPGEWTEISKSAAKIQFDSEVQLGLASTGKARFNNTVKTDLPRQLYDDFSSTVPGSMFTIVNPDTSKYNIENNKLIITSSKDSSNIFVTNVPGGQDWSAKTKVAFKPEKDGQEVMLLSMQDSANKIKVSRLMHNGKNKIGFGKVIDGYSDYAYLVDDEKPDSDLYLQLQRVGSRYSAIYSYDDKNWSAVGNHELANFSVAFAGITTVAKDNSKINAAFDFFTLGNAIKDQVSINNGITEGKADTSFDEIASINTMGAWNIANGNWSYIPGGYLQTDKGENVHMDLLNKTYDNLYFETSVKINGNNGWAGVSFRREKEKESYKDSGYLLKLTHEGKVAFMKGSTYLVPETKLPSKVDVSMPIRTVIQAKGESIKVFVNDIPEPVIDIIDGTYKSGYISLYSSSCEAQFLNVTAMHDTSIWTPYQGAWNKGPRGVFSSIGTHSKYAWLGLTGKAFTDVVVQTNVNIQSLASTESGMAGILLHSSAGKHYLKDGIFAYLHNDGRIGLSEKGKVLKEVTFNTDDKNAANLIVLYRNGKYSIYVNWDKKPVLEYEDDKPRSGNISLFSSDCSAQFSDVSVWGGSVTEDLEVLKVFDRTVGSGGGSINTQPFSDSFSSDESKKSWLPYEGVWSFANGVYATTDASSWNNGSALTTGKYKNFILEFKLKHTGGQGWVGVNFRKNAFSDTHEQSGYLLYMNNSGGIAIYRNNMGEIGKGAIPNFNPSKFTAIKIVAQGDNLKVYANNSSTSVINVSNNSYLSGYISLVAGMAEAQYTDFKITPIN